MLVNIGLDSLPTWVENRCEKRITCMTLKCLCVKCSTCIIQSMNGNAYEKLVELGRVKED